MRVRATLIAALALVFLSLAGCAGPAPTGGATSDPQRSSPERGGGDHGGGGMM